GFLSTGHLFCQLLLTRHTGSRPVLSLGDEETSPLSPLMRSWKRFTPHYSRPQLAPFFWRRPIRAWSRLNSRRGCRGSSRFVLPPGTFARKIDRKSHSSNLLM